MWTCGYCVHRCVDLVCWRVKCEYFVYGCVIRYEELGCGCVDTVLRTWMCGCGVGCRGVDVWILCIWWIYTLDMVWGVVVLMCGYFRYECVDVVWGALVMCWYGAYEREHVVWAAVCIRCGCGAGCCGHDTSQLKNVASAKQHSLHIQNPSYMKFSCQNNINFSSPKKSAQFL
jgi:hypothetical protein